ncbi:DUF4274 domain-containing protein [Wielerella bovis]|uniref:DUF4274 domain-containing protein n=1 Tax=Wielerella bovis TaxID=2917790 RepID=UPI002018EB18|nr:DUF4274 domain-containing protein [Wielerella bovis]ULJ68626.1 DUF4274 domain-containing protein [Wielerella bovis]
MNNETEKLILDFLKNATPAEQFNYAARSNYDDNKAGLAWLIDQPETERAVILKIYWNLGADYLTQFDDEQDVPYFVQEDWRLTRLIEARYTNGFYTNANIWYDPYDTDGGMPFEYEDIVRVREVPAEMLATINGHDFVDLEIDFEEYDEGLPSEIVNKLYALDESD